MAPRSRFGVHGHSWLSEPMLFLANHFSDAVDKFYIAKMQNSIFVSTLLLLGAASPVLAASLQVSPVSLELPASVKASQLTLHNLGDAPIDAQIRVFHWTQQDGEERLTPSSDLVASPPAATLSPGQDYTVRVVRVSEKPVDSEESYRLLVDELPQSSPQPGKNVNFVVRYSIPIFFAHTNTDPQLVWTAYSQNGRLVLRVRNDGARHIRISALSVESPSGASISFGSGLVGYVLAHSATRWTGPAAPKGMIPGTTLRITAQGDNGEISATAAMQTTK